MNQLEGWNDPPLPVEVFAATEDGEPEQTANASNDEDGPEEEVQDA